MAGLPLEMGGEREILQAETLDHCKKGVRSAVRGIIVFQFAIDHSAQELSDALLPSFREFYEGVCPICRQQ
jgi:hypothetical protein